MAPDLRVKQEAGKALVPFLSKDRHNLFERGRGDPRHIVLRLEATAAGCQWLIDRWANLRAWLDQGVDWRTNELIAALQLRGQRPLRKDAIEWQGVVEPILPTGNPAAIAEARRRMLLQFDHGLPDDPAGQRAALCGWWTRRRSGWSSGRPGTVGARRPTGPSWPTGWRWTPRRKGS